MCSGIVIIIEIVLFFQWMEIEIGKRYAITNGDSLKTIQMPKYKNINEFITVTFYYKNVVESMAEIQITDELDPAYDQQLKDLVS